MTNKGNLGSVCPEMGGVYPDLQLGANSVQAVHSPTSDNNKSRDKKKKKVIRSLKI